MSREPEAESVIAPSHSWNWSKILNIIYIFGTDAHWTILNLFTSKLFFISTFSYFRLSQLVVYLLVFSEVYWKFGESFYFYFTWKNVVFVKTNKCRNWWAESYFFSPMYVIVPQLWILKELRHFDWNCETWVCFVKITLACFVCFTLDAVL